VRVSQKKNKKEEGECIASWPKQPTSEWMEVGTDGPNVRTGPSETPIDQTVLLAPGRPIRALA
jgi:hypothetical protein